MDRYNTCHECQGDVLLRWDSSRNDLYEFCPQCGRIGYLPVIDTPSEGNSDISALSKYLRERQNELPVGM